MTSAKAALPSGTLREGAPDPAQALVAAHLSAAQGSFLFLTKGPLLVLFAFRALLLADD